MIKKLKIRLADVASESGVSVTTVDRVIHGRPGVKRHTASHILSVIDRLESGGALDEVYSGENSRVHQNKRCFDVILPKGFNAFYNNFEKEILECASRPIYSSSTIRIHRVSSFNPIALVAAIRSVSTQTDGIAIVAIDDPRVRDEVNRVVNKGIPLITLVSDLTASQRTAYVGVDNRACGRTAGYLMGRFLGEKQGSVLMLAGSHLLRDHEQREIGFMRVLREHFKQLKIIPFLEDKDDDDAAYEQVKKALNDNSDLVGIYDIGAGTQGIAKALQEAERGSDVVFIGHELTQYSRELLTDGVMDAVIDQVPRKEARLLMEMFESGSDDGIDRQDSSITAAIFFRENLP